MFKYLYATILISLLSTYIFGQVELSSNKLKQIAESSEISGDAYSAIYYYELLQIKKPQSSTQSRLANLYIETRNYEQAKAMFLSLVGESNSDSKLYLQLGLCYKQMGQYDSCIYYLDKCKVNKLKAIDKVLLKNEYKGALLGIESPLDTSVVNINESQLSINSQHMESAPYFVNDSLIIYATQIVNDENLYLYSDTNYMPSYKLFYARKEANNWIKSGELSEINNRFNNVGNGYFSLNKELFYFTNTIKNWNNKNVSEIYVCEYEDGTFLRPVKLNNDINDAYYTSTQPAVGTAFNPDLEVVYFSSDRPGGKGGLDIWYTVFYKKRGYYRVPINAGSRINTALNEITPYYDKNTKTLYYSSNGLIGLGGYDVYKSIGELKSWTKPQNIGSYLNSNADEIYFRLNNSRNAGFIVSNNPIYKANESSYCCFDLRYFEYKNPDQLRLSGTLVAKINPIIEKLLESGIEFRDSTIKQNEHLKDAVVSLYLKTDLGTDSLFITSDTTDSEGLFEFDAGSDQDYSLIIHENNEVKAQVSVSTKGNDSISNREIVLDIKPIESLPDVPLVIKNIYYESGESDLTLSAKEILDNTLIKLLSEIKNIKVEISSHTDDVGEADYNYKLSEKRADNVAKYLIQKGVNKDRLMTKGYGETDPIASNINDDGTSNEEGRKKNRRTEFRIMGTIKGSFGL